MNTAIDAPKRPALRYYGGKWNLAPWIISYFPPHKNYVEPCGGAASVLLQKPRSPLENYNDLDGNVVNFFRVLRDYQEEFIQKIRLTPWARVEFELSLLPPKYEDSKNYAIECARRFYVCHWMGVRQTLNTTEGQVRFAAVDKGYYMHLPSDGLQWMAARFFNVQIECSPYDYVIKKFDTPETLFYFDPPYVSETRRHDDVYMVEFTEEDHEIASMQLRQCSGHVVVSGYACPLYTELYESHGWQRVDREAQTNSGGKRIESLWLSPRTWAALNHDYSDMPMFAQG